MVQRVVVVTGGGSGIGRAVARELLGRGHAVVLAGRRPEALAETAAGSDRALCVPTDVADPDSVRALFDQVRRGPGRCDVLFNNAGVFGPAASVDTITDEQWDQTWRVNVSGMLYCAREAVAMMREQGGGRVVNNASIAAHVPRPQTVAYATTKHAITGLTRSITLDGRADNISATRLDVGNALTEMTAAFDNALQADGSRRAEPGFDTAHLAPLVGLIAELPFEVAVPELMVMATGMPFAGRG